MNFRERKPRLKKKVESYIRNIFPRNGKAKFIFSLTCVDVVFSHRWSSPFVGIVLLTGKEWKRFYNQSYLTFYIPGHLCPRKSFQFHNTWVIVLQLCRNFMSYLKWALKQGENVLVKYYRQLFPKWVEDKIERKSKIFNVIRKSIFTRKRFVS